MAEPLVIGYGNDLRADDGAGRWVADRLDGYPGVDVLSVPQLTPELALHIAGRYIVVFVDASVEVGSLSVREVSASKGATVMTHHGDPASLLSMVAEVGAEPAKAYLVSIPASNLEIGFGMTPATRGAAEEAVDVITTLVGPHHSEGSRGASSAAG